MTEILSDELARLELLRERSGGRLTFQTGPVKPPHQYLVTLRCSGLYLKQGVVSEIGEHQVQIELGPEYPIRPPDLVWRTPIYHPNILAWKVCLVGQNWGAKTHLDDVCIWLWDMVRYRLYNLNDPLDKPASAWAAQHEDRFPLDPFDLRAAAVAPAASRSEERDLAGSILLLEGDAE
jgi:ubiquitin-protein ligase